LRFTLASQLIKRQGLPDDTRNGGAEPLGVRQLAIIEPERLFVQITEQVKWFHAHVGSINAAL
jgi:hypothetical protein